MSSSYSELRQAHHPHILAGQIPSFNNNTEGDYEPVIPPKPGVLNTSTGAGAGRQKHFKSLSSSSSESDCLGTCVKCGERIVGEGSGCSAMGRPYHILCFTCAGKLRLMMREMCVTLMFRVQLQTTGSSILRC